MSMTLAARATHIHHVSARAPAQARALPLTQHFAPLIWFRRRLKARPGTTLAHCVFALAACTIVINSLAFQRQDSPRYLVGEQVASQSRAVPTIAVIPVPPVRPAELAASPVRIQGASQVPVVSAGTSPAVRQGSTAPAARDQQGARDPIGDLIRSGQVAGSPVASDASRAATVVNAVPARPAADNRPVIAAQRALNRVGVGPVKADGVFGEETRAALERFERERRIPVTRDLSPRTLRELTAASGIRME
ncbi:MAG: peptidoglycan-binding protein [Bosea sp. (in: a-proteobacteria)]